MPIESFFNPYAHLKAIKPTFQLEEQKKNIQLLQKYIFSYTYLFF